MTPTNTQPDAMRLAEEREAFEATMKTHFPGWSFASDGCGGYHNFTADAAWVAWQARAEVEKLRQGGEAWMQELLQVGAEENDRLRKQIAGYERLLQFKAVIEENHASQPLQADAGFDRTASHSVGEYVCASQADAQSEERFKPPFANCRFQLCDLPGQCRVEGNCHHPAPLQADACKVPLDLSAFDAAVYEELSKVSTVPYNSHEICKWFAQNVRAMLSAAPTQAHHVESAYTAGLESATGHLSALVDDLRGLLGRAMAEMKALEESAKPVNESRGDFDAMIPYEKWAKFVDGRAALLHAIHESPHELPAAPTQVETQGNNP